MMNLRKRHEYGMHEPLRKGKYEPFTDDGTNVDVDGSAGRPRETFAPIIAREKWPESLTSNSRRRAAKKKNNENEENSENEKIIIMKKTPKMKQIRQPRTIGRNTGGARNAC